MKLQTFNQLRLQYKKFGNSQSKMIDFYQKCLILTQQIIQDVSKQKTKEYAKSKKYISNTEAMQDFYELKIADAFVAHHVLLKAGVILPSYNHLRSIYEILLTIYLSKIYPDLGELKINYDLLENNLLPSKEKDLIRTNYKKNQYLKASFIEKKLYNTEVQQQLRKFYQHLCSYIHPSIKALSVTFEFNSAMLLDSYQLGIALTNCNFVILLELYADNIRKSQRKKILNLSKQYSQYISRGVLNLIPTQNTALLRINNHNQFNTILTKGS